MSNLPIVPPPYFPPFLWKFWLSEAGPERQCCHRLHIYDVCNGKLSETKRVPEQPRDIFHDFEVVHDDAGDCDLRNGYLQALRDAQAAFSTLETEAESILSKILESLRSNSNTITLHQRNMMVLRKFFVFWWFRNSRQYSETLAKCQDGYFKVHWARTKMNNGDEAPNSPHSLGSFSLFRMRTILRSFHRFLQLDHLLMCHPSTIPLGVVDEGFLKLCSPDITELLVSVTSGKQEYILSDACFGVLDEGNDFPFGNTFFPLTPNVVFYLMERSNNGLKHIMDDRIQLYNEKEEDVDMRNTVLFRSNPRFLYFCSLPSIVLSITTLETTCRSRDSDMPDYSSLRARCRQKSLQESVTKTLVLKGSVTVTDLTDEITLIEESPIAFGSFADIWKGHWRQTDGNSVVVALKILRRVMFSAVKDKLFKRLKDEVLAWHRLHHPHIAPLHGIVQLQMTLGMASPWCDNGTIVRYLRENPETDRVEMLAQVASGVAYLHDFKPTVIHGDLKGGNILVDDDGQVKITDFGLSKVIEDFSDTLHMHIPTSFFAGSTRWMAPELIMALVEDDCGGGDDGTGVSGGTIPPITTYSDIYAFGAVGIEILTGQLPFPMRTNDHAVTIDIMRGVKPSRGVTRGKIVLPCMPSGYRSAEELWSMLECCWNSDRYARPSMSWVVKFLGKV